MRRETRIRSTAARLALVLSALVTEPTGARQITQAQMAAQQPGHPHLVIVESDNGFIIRCETRANPQSARLPNGAIPPFAIPLGASIRIDRAALLPTNTKDISHGEPR